MFIAIIIPMRKMRNEFQLNTLFLHLCVCVWVQAYCNAYSSFSVSYLQLEVAIIILKKTKQRNKVFFCSLFCISFPVPRSVNTKVVNVFTLYLPEARKYCLLVITFMTKGWIVAAVVDNKILLFFHSHWSGLKNIAASGD